MRLRIPGGTSQALQTVRQVRGELNNASVHGSNAAQRKDAVLSWFDNWATQQLGNHFPATEDVFAEITVSHERLLMLPPLTERQLNGVLHRECREWDAHLERMEAELGELMTFLARPGRLVVPDTSALMEGAFFTEFDWHTLDPSLRGEAVRLVVLSVVTEELDELKRNRDGRQRARARRVLAAVWNLHRAAPGKPAPLPRFPDVTAEVLLDGGWHRRMPNNDGEIIDQAASLRDLTGQPVILAAAGYTQLYRAAPTGLTAVLMSQPGQP